MKYILVLILYTSTGYREEQVTVPVSMDRCVEVGEIHITEGWYGGNRVAGYTCRQQ